MLKRILAGIVRIVLLFVLLSCGTLFVFQSRLIYFPQPSPPSVVSRFLETGGRRIDYQTSQGNQTAWLIPPLLGGVPERFWIICAGNASQALSLQFLPKAADLPHDAFLLVDYPGYGVSQGTPSPRTIRENLTTAVPLAAAAVGFPMSGIAERGVAFGHSLGAATTLLGAETFGIRRVVLLAPFTSTMDMAEVVVHLPLGLLATHRFDNVARLTGLKARGGHAWIFHGARDHTIPVSMSQTLAAEMGNSVSYHEIPDADHNDLFSKVGPAIYQAMRDARNGE